MRLAVRRVFLLAVLAASTSGAARGQTVCGQLYPFGVVPPEGGFAFGCANRYVLKRSTNSGSPETYLLLVLPACASGPCDGLIDPQKFICEAANGYACCMTVSQSIPLVAGNYAGPLRQGLSQRIASDTDTIPGICYADYAGNGSRLGDVSLINPVGLGASHAQVAGFIRMFLTGPLYGNSDLVVEFIAGPTEIENVSWGRTKIRYR
jgi:hypothetical protein